jgi:vacuolar-type H+-ATPase subunit I/STV1
MDDRLDDRVDAVERAITDGHAADGLPDAARMERRLDDLEATVDELDDRLAELEAAVQALRGFAGGVRAVDEEVERRANAAVARVERLEAELRDAEGRTADGRDDENAGAHADVDDPDGNRGASADKEGDHVGDTGAAVRRGRTDATLAEAAADAAASVERSAGEAVADEGGGRSLADRVRRLL